MIHDLETIDKEEFMTMSYLDNIKFLGVYFELTEDLNKTFNTDWAFDDGDYLKDEVKDRFECLRKRKFIRKAKPGWTITKKSKDIIKKFLS